jgi:hypothetical protein
MFTYLGLISNPWWRRSARTAWPKLGCTQHTDILKRTLAADQFFLPNSRMYTTNCPICSFVNFPS